MNQFRPARSWEVRHRGLRTPNAADYRPADPAGGVRLGRRNDAAIPDRPDPGPAVAGRDRPGRGQPATDRRDPKGRGGGPSSVSGQPAHSSAEFSASVFDPIRHSRADLVILAGFLALVKIPRDYKG